MAFLIVGAYGIFTEALWLLHSLPWCLDGWMFLHKRAILRPGIRLPLAAHGMGWLFSSCVPSLEFCPHCDPPCPLQIEGDNKSINVGKLLFAVFASSTLS